MKLLFSQKPTQLHKAAAPEGMAKAPRHISGEVSVKVSARHMSGCSAARMLAMAITFCSAFSGSAALLPETAWAYDEYKVEKYGLVRGDLSTWTQRRSSFPENRTMSVTGDTPLSAMGCSYYATFFMLCRMGIKDPLKDTAWEFAMECKRKKLSRDGTGYFDPRSISKLTGGRVKFVESGNCESYYDGQAGVARCENHADMLKLIRRLTKKGYYLVACAVGHVTNYQGEEYYSEGHYIFIDSILDDDFMIGDSAFPGTRWSDNWGAHGASIVKIYAYKLLDDDGDLVKPSERQSMYVERLEDED